VQQLPSSKHSSYLQAAAALATSSMKFLHTNLTCCYICLDCAIPYGKHFTFPSTCIH
jgi:hypothetical protein